MERVCIYLRKSRADQEAEERGEGETLAKHRKVLFDVARERNLHVVKVREEIASGESIQHRPEMVALLQEVKSGHYDAVLVMDIDRLGRGNMQDQGIILETFKQAKTAIITPRKTYNLDDEFDEEYSEFEAFMARKEFKIIKRRLHQGRIRSVKDGNYIGSRAPYGYNKTKVGKDHTLTINEEQATIVRMIFDWYIHDGLGSLKIAKKLNDMGVPSANGKDWTNNVVLQILRNPVYIGKVRWRHIERKKSKEPGKNVTATRRNEEEAIIVDGKHPPLIPEDVFFRAEAIRKNKIHPHWKLGTALKNPLAGLIICGKCGSAMVMKYGRTKNRHQYLTCDRNGAGCTNKSSRLDLVEEHILNQLRQWLTHYKMTIEPSEIADAEKGKKVETYLLLEKNLRQEIAHLQTQQEKLHDLLERGIYDETTFLKRSQSITNRLQVAEAALKRVEADIRQEQSASACLQSKVSEIEHVLDVYPAAETYQQNQLLKLILDKCVYLKEKHQKNDEFELQLYPRLNSQQ
ncbi:recombinase family protein [Laceyella sacchari]|nr:recombinase family protein [Laceyella sacchari]